MRIIGIWPNTDPTRYGGTGICALSVNGSPRYAFTIRPPAMNGTGDLIALYERVDAALERIFREEHTVTWDLAVGIPDDPRSAVLAGMIIGARRARIIPRRTTIARERIPDGLIGKRVGLSFQLSDNGSRRRDQHAYEVAITAAGTGS